MKGNNLVPVPGELQSVAEGGIVAAAESIYDYKKQKNQETINEETEDKVDGFEQRLNTVENNVEHLSTSIMQTVNNTLDEAITGVNNSIAANNRSVTNRLAENENAMSNMQVTMNNVIDSNNDIKEAIELLDPDTHVDVDVAQQVVQNTQNIEKCEQQLGGLSFVVVTQQQYDNLVALDEVDPHTIYFIKED